MAEDQAPKHEQRWSCGCHEVDDAVVVQCTQVKLQGEVLAHHNLNSPYSAVCFRTKAEVIVGPPDRAEVAAEILGTKPAPRRPTLADFDTDPK